MGLCLSHAQLLRIKDLPAVPSPAPFSWLILSILQKMRVPPTNSEISRGSPRRIFLAGESQRVCQYQCVAV